MNQKNDPWHISPVSAEFTEPEIEADFRAHTAGTMARQLRSTLWVWVAALLFISWMSYRFYGAVPSSHLLLGSRLVVLVALLLLIIRSHQSPDYITDGHAVTFMEMVGFAVFFLVFMFRPELTIYKLGVMVVLLIAVYVFIPNRLVTATAAAIVGIAGLMFTMWVVGLSGREQLGLFLLLAIPAALGHVTAYRLHRAQREQYVLLRQAEASNAQMLKEIEQRKLLERELKHQAITDPLTGLFNRRHFEELYHRERERARRQGTPLMLVMVDLDHFKQVNDRYGHDSGDRVLRHVAAYFKDGLRQTDVIGRLGGEEFMLLLPDTECSEAQAMIERVRSGLAERTIKVGSEEEISVTATFALVAVQPEKDSLDLALKAVDQALYRGKDEGRNRLVIVPVDAA